MKRVKYVKESLHILFFVFLLCGCASRFTTLKQLPEALPNEVVVFIPGFKGSILKDAETAERIWITTGKAVFGGGTLTIDQPGLELPTASSPLIADGILTEVSGLGGILHFDVYDSSLQNLAKIFAPIPVIEFSYDWRQDTSRNAAELDKLIDRLHAQGASKITLVAHSFGCVVTAYFLRYGAADIDEARENWAGQAKVSRVVFAGAPFHGAITMFRDMQQGVATLFNHSLLTRESLSSFPSSYQLLPGPADQAFIREDLTSANEPMHNVHAWEQYGWGLLADRDVPEAVWSARKAFTQEQLRRAGRLTELMQAPLAVKSKLEVPILHIVGVGYRTFTRGIWIENKDLPVLGNHVLTQLTFPVDKHILFHDGDGVVPRESARLPQAFIAAGQSREVEIHSSHLDILSSREASEIIQTWIMDLKPGII